mmetsp:Transcript_16487/g.49228  ORF Transcript_16487/g.49228 Transcript_16487/m.49228 type:complete len:234 (-) Transcript_16487:460-1161(-)
MTMTDVAGMAPTPSKRKVKSSSALGGARLTNTANRSSETRGKPSKSPSLVARGIRPPSRTSKVQFDLQSKQRPAVQHAQSDGEGAYTSTDSSYTCASCGNNGVSNLRRNAPADPSSAKASNCSTATVLTPPKACCSRSVAERGAKRHDSAATCSVSGGGRPTLKRRRARSCAHSPRRFPKPASTRNWPESSRLYWLRTSTSETSTCAGARKDGKDTVVSMSSPSSKDEMSKDV